MFAMYRRHAADAIRLFAHVRTELIQWQIMLCAWLDEGFTGKEIELDLRKFALHDAAVVHTASVA